MEFERFRAAVGENLKKSRWLVGLTQEQVEGVTIRHYQELECGRGNPTLETLFRLAEQYGVTVADLVNVPGARPDAVPLSKKSAHPPKVGRKARS